MVGSDAFRNLVRPRLAEFLELLHLDVTYERAAGCHVWPAGSTEPVLDLVGGYGTLLFGHNHPELVNAAVNYLRAGRPIHAQGSLKPYTGALAERLSRGRWHVLFANSGTEAVEIALKHALLNRRGPIVALEGAFHGKTLGSLQLTHNPQYREGFELGLEVVRIPPNDLEQLRGAFSKHRPSALFLELIQGEGGVIPLSPEFVTLARELCSETLLVIDECQTGIGRTGTFLACEHYDVSPDLIILSKALGGGIAKLAAVLIRSDRYLPELGWIHTSTYADDDLSSAIGLAVLDLLTPEALARCAETGQWLKHRLVALKDEFPSVVADVRGLGLMLGIELAPAKEGFLLPLFGEDLGLVVAGYLYHEHRIRIAPTLSNPLTLRIQPPLVTPRAELERLVAALRDVCEKISSGDALGLTRYFLPASTPKSQTVRDGFAVHCTDRPTQNPRIGWLFHLIDADDLVSLEPRFAALSFSEREEYLLHLERRAVPIVMNSMDITTRTEQQVRFNAILLPLTARRIKELMDARDTAWLRALVERGIDVAETLGCDVVSLGQYTSIVMLNGLLVKRRSIGVTTGNAYAVALAVEAIERAFPDLRRRRVGVVGAAGNIGAVSSEILAERCAEIILVGRDAPGSIERMKRLNLPRARITTDVSECRHADIVLVAVNTPTPVVEGVHLAHDAFVCDLSVPAGVDASDRSDVTVIRGGLARLPYGEDHRIPGFPIDSGLAFACMTEGMILALEGIHDRSFTGSLSADHIRRIASLAKKHGFELAAHKTHAVLGSFQ